MSNISLPFAFSPQTRIKSSDVNADLNAIVTEYNAHAVTTDAAKTVTASHTFSGSQSFTGGLTALVANTFSGTTASLANGAGTSILAPTVSGMYLAFAKATGTHTYHATAVMTYSATTALATVTVLASNGITLAASSGAMTLTNATGSSSTFGYSYLRIL